MGTLVLKISFTILYSEISNKHFGKRIL